MAFRLAPTAALAGFFALGFLGHPEDSAWLNSSHLWGPGDPFFSDVDKRFVSHSVLIWRGRPSFRGRTAYEYGGVQNPYSHNSHGLRDDEIAPLLAPGVVRVLNLGDSSTWGLNLKDRSDTYSDQLEALLAARGLAGRFDVVNAGTIGYSSLQGVRFLEYWLDELRPDVVTIYLGNNEFLPSGSKDRERSPDQSGGLRAGLSRNFFYLLLRKSLLALYAPAAARRAEEFRELWRSRGQLDLHESKEVYYQRVARVAPTEYETNLRRMVALCRGAGARPILLEVPMNLLWPLQHRPRLEDVLRLDHYWSPAHTREGYIGRVHAGERVAEHALAGHPYLSLATPEESAALLAERGAPAGELLPALRALAEAAEVPQRLRARTLHNLGVWHLIEGELPAAARHLEVALELAEAEGQPTRPFHRARIYYALGVLRLLEGRSDEARALLEQARAIFPWAMGPDYAQALTRVARELAVESIDLPARFARADPAFWGSALISDWVHPNAEGSRVIAEAIAERLLEGETSPPATR